MHTGSGLILSGIDGAIVEHCTAYHNGWLNARGGGPSGIWGWDCNNLVIQYCESHHNEAGGQRDGGGFDLDGGCTNSVLQYNYSHDNDGPGYLLVQFDYARPMNNLVVRYNVSVNDGKIQEQGGILIYSSGWDGGIENADIYNNTIILDRPANGSTPNGIYLFSGDISNITVRNNIFQVAAGLRVLRTFTTTGVRFEGNCYWSSGGALAFDWNGAGRHAGRLARRYGPRNAGQRRPRHRHQRCPYVCGSQLRPATIYTGRLFTATRPGPGLSLGIRH